MDNKQRVYEALLGRKLPMSGLELMKQLDLPRNTVENAIEFLWADCLIAYVPTTDRSGTSTVRAVPIQIALQNQMDAEALHNPVAKGL